MAASLNEIYKMLGELTGTVRAINEKVDELKRDVTESEVASADSRANVHRRLDEVVLRTAQVEVEVSGIKHRVEEVGDRVDAVSAVTDDVKAMRQQAQGAGTLGAWLIKIGVGVIGAAGWAVGVYTYLTGKPPP